MPVHRVARRRGAIHLAERRDVLPQSSLPRGEAMSESLPSPDKRHADAAPFVDFMNRLAPQWQVGMESAYNTTQMMLAFRAGQASRSHAPRIECEKCGNPTDGTKACTLHGERCIFAPSTTAPTADKALIPVGRIPRLIELVSAACREAAVMNNERSYELWTAVRSELNDAMQTPAVSALSHALPIAQGECETTQTPRFQIKDCACGTYEGNLGPCLTWWEGAQVGRCVYCDHSLDCHVKLSKLFASAPSTTRRTMTLPDVIGPVTPLVEEITERCGNMEGTESMQEVVAGVLNALVQTFEEWPQGFAPSATPRSIPVELCEKVVRRYTWMIDNPGAPIAGGVSFDAAMAELRTAVVIALHDPKPNNSPDGGKATNG